MTAQKRLLIFSLAYQPFVGGAEVAVKEITDRLPDYDFDLLTVNLDRQQKATEKIGAVSVYRSNSPKYFFPLAACLLAVKLHQKNKYDAIWSIMANQAGLAAALFKRCFPRVPWLLTLQEGDDLNSLAYRLRLLAPRWFGVFKSADQIQVISNYLSAWARRMGATAPISVVPNGVDVSNFQVLASSFQLKDNENKIIITTSRLVKKNGVDTLIEAMQFLPNNVRLQILGTGPKERSLRKLVSRLNLDGRIKFLGQVSPNEIPNYLASADIFVRPARSEGLGNSFLEAMAAGVPIVGTPVGGIPDFLHDPQWQGESLPFGKDSPLGQTGWFCEVGNPKSVAEKISFILDPSNFNLVNEVITKARKVVTEKYHWHQISIQIGHIFEKLIAKNEKNR